MPAKKKKPIYIYTYFIPHKELHLLHKSSNNLGIKKKTVICSVIRQQTGLVWIQSIQMWHSFAVCAGETHSAQSLFGLLFLWSDGADARGPVGERVPLALDAGVVRVERLADADHVQAGLIGQFGQKI